MLFKNNASFFNNFQSNSTENQFLNILKFSSLTVIKARLRDNETLEGGLEKILKEKSCCVVDSFMYQSNI